MRWGLSQQKAAQLLGGGVNAFSKYERGEVMQSRSMDLLMRMYNEVPDVRDRLATLSGTVTDRRWVTDKMPKVHGIVSHSGVKKADAQRFQNALNEYKPSQKVCEELVWAESDGVAYGT
jgi:Cys-tRNA synthase (O-phospho-L-seryl-tRNA:Cys-tRNA synthase)